MNLGQKMGKTRAYKWADAGLWVPANLTLAQVERLVIEHTLGRTRSKTECARRLGIYRSKLYALLDRHGIKA
jgi:DNA-binding NtrC family response regulator